MKKILLLLSCFLTTWCGVQAANPQITSATYNESTSQFNVSYTASGSNNYVQMICKATGPVGSNVKLNSSPATVDLPITARAGGYVLVLYVNGSSCYGKEVTVTKYGHINSITGISTSSVTVNYNMFHAETSNSYLKIVGVGTQPISNVKNGSYTWTGLNLTAGKEYTCEIWVDGKKFDSRTFTVPDIYVNVIKKLTYTGGSLKIDFSLRNTGANVGFRVHAFSASGNKGETKYYDYGRCDKHEGTYTVPVPRYTGQVIYVVEYQVNGTNVNGASITAYNR